VFSKFELEFAVNKKFIGAGMPCYETAKSFNFEVIVPELEEKYYYKELIMSVGAVNIDYINQLLIINFRDFLDSKAILDFIKDNKNVTKINIHYLDKMGNLRKEIRFGNLKARNINRYFDYDSIDFCRTVAIFRFCDVNEFVHIDINFLEDKDPTV
jgi:hypothetical protein